MDTLHTRNFVRYPVSQSTIGDWGSTVVYSMELVLGTGTRVATRYPGTRSGPGYPGNFITRLLSTQHCRLDCEFGVIDNVYHTYTANLHANCRYITAQHDTSPIYYGVTHSAYLLITQDSARPVGATAWVTHLRVVFMNIIERCVQIIYKDTRWQDY